MNLGDTTKPLGDGIFGRRFYLVGYLPVYAAALFLLLIIWAGARGWDTPAGPGFSFTRAWRKADSISLGQSLVLLLGVTLTAVLLQPLQLWLIRLLEGDRWPPSLRQLACARQAKRMKSLLAQAKLNPAAESFEGSMPPKLDPADVQRAGVAGRRLRQCFPLSEQLIQPTSLGNVLTAMRDTAGRQYGMDAVIIWPRLYPVLSDAVRAFVDDRRDTFDVSARMSAVMLLTSFVSLVLLLDTGWWCLLAVIPLGISALAYGGAVQGALAYSEAVQVAFDLNRGELLEALRMPRPGSRPEEEALNRQWSDFWRQGIPLSPAVKYEFNQSEHYVVLREKK